MDNKAQVIVEATRSGKEIRIPTDAAVAPRVAAELADRFQCRVRVELVQVFEPSERPPTTPIAASSGHAPSPQEARLNESKAPDIILRKMRSEPQRAFRVDDLVDPDRGLDKRRVGAALYRLWKEYELVEQVSRGKFRARGMEVKSG